MNDSPIPPLAPSGWLEALDRGEAQLAAGQIVPADDIIRELDESLARLGASQAARLKHRTVSHL
jgi:hypothetical protein